MLLIKSSDIIENEFKELDNSYSQLALIKFVEHFKIYKIYWSVFNN